MTATRNGDIPADRGPRYTQARPDVRQETMQ